MEFPIPAYIPAGSNPEKPSSLCLAANVKNKALIPLAGKPIIHYVIDALDNAKHVKSITIVGLDENDIDVSTQKPLNFVPATGTNFDTALAAVNYFTSLESPPEYVLSLSSDIPFVTSEIVDKNLELANSLNKKYREKKGVDVELFYPLTPKSIVIKKFPQANKRYRKFKEGTFATGDFFVYRPESALKPEAQKVTQSIMKNRKSMVKILLGFGPFAIFKYFFGKMSLETDVKPAMKKIMNIELETLISKNPEICVDLDYPEDLEKFEILIKAKQITD